MQFFFSLSLASRNISKLNFDVFAIPCHVPTPTARILPPSQAPSPAPKIATIWTYPIPSCYLLRLYQSNWMKTRCWWYTRGWIVGNSGPLQRTFQLWRSNPLWYMHPILVEDCQASGGSCGRDCGCCLDSQRANSLAGALGAGHCTMECGCCSKFRGFELNQRDKDFLVDCFSFDHLYDTMDHQENPYQHRICLVAIWGLSLNDS